MARLSKTDSLQRIAGLIKGLKKRYSGQPTLLFGGKDHVIAELLVAFQQVIDLHAEAASLHAKWIEKLRQARVKGREVHPLVVGLERLVRGRFGPSAPALHDFDLKVRGRRTPRVMVKAEAVEKRKATREARGTMGKRQKAKIKGR